MSTGTSRQPLQGCHIAASAGDPRDDSAHGKRRAQRHQAESAVGAAVDVRHFAATPEGRDVTATAEVVKVEGKRIHFKVAASDGIEEIGSGTHERVVIDLRSFNERLAKKSRL
jgi:fluoroacetyl-CoA thioesterase